MAEKAAKAKSSWGTEAAQKTRAPKTDLVQEMQKILFKNPITLPEMVPTCAMIYGEDGTGKTGLTLSTLTDDDVENGKVIVVVDLDSGNLPLILEHHSHKVAKGAIKYWDPTVWGEDEEGRPVLNYKKTMDIINAIALASKQEWQENQSIKAIILDGGSKLLKFSEQQMRLEKALTPDGGVQTRYWLVRNKMFLETLDLYKSLPFDKYFIFHEDFIPVSGSADKLASVKIQTNQMMFQKIHCERVDKGPTVEYKARIDKSKFDITKEGKVITFGEVNKKDESFVWNPNKVIRELRKENKDLYPDEIDDINELLKEAKSEKEANF